MVSVGIRSLTLCLFICISVLNAKRMSRSIDGVEAFNIPYQVSIQTSAGEHRCGGAILDATHILTAAYCLVDAHRNPYTDVREVVLGTTDRFNLTEDNVFQIVKKTIHERFSAHHYFQNDIAVLKLDGNITFTPYRKAIMLPRKRAARGAIGIASGWGATQWSRIHRTGDGFPRYLRYVYQEILSEEQCQKMMPDVIILPEHLCAWGGGRGVTCKGDSGGPLVVGKYIVGINSWNQYCDPAYPDIYTHVYKYVDWIKDAMAD